MKKRVESATDELLLLLHALLHFMDLLLARLQIGVKLLDPLVHLGNLLLLGLHLLLLGLLSEQR